MADEQAPPEMENMDKFDAPVVDKHPDDDFDPQNYLNQDGDN